MNCPTCFSDRSLSTGRYQYKGIYNIYTSNFAYKMLKLYNSSYKCNSVDIMDGVMLTYSWLKFIYMPLFTMCIVICSYTFTYITFRFRRMKSYMYIEVSGIGRCCTHARTHAHAHTEREREREREREIKYTCEGKMYLTKSKMTSLK